jgi:hypothetical protein
MNGGAVSEAPASRESRLVGIETRASHRLLAQLEVEAHLLGEFGTEPVAAEEVQEAAEERSEHRIWFP